jgi:hypothetical protein
VLDGVYRRTEGEPVFGSARALTGDELAGLLDPIIARLIDGSPAPNANLRAAAIPQPAQKDIATAHEHAHGKAVG